MNGGGRRFEREMPRRRPIPGSIKTSIILSFMLLVLIIVLFLSLLTYRYTMWDIESMSINYTMRLLDEVNSNIDSYIDNMKSMGRVIVENTDVRELMSFYNMHRGEILSYLEERERDELQDRAAAHMDIVANTRSDITNVAIISKYGDILLNDRTKTVNPYSEYNLTDWFLRPLSYKDDIIVSPSHVQNLVDGEYKWVISISKAITNPETGDVTGVMVIDLNYRSIEAICENAQLGKNGYIYLIDSNQNIIFHPQQHLVYSGIKSEEIKSVLQLDDETPYMRASDSNIYLRHYSPLTDWSAVGVVNTEELTRNKSGTIRYYVILSCVSILFASVIAVLLSTTITRPIKKLENTMHKVEEGDLSIRSEITINNEIGHLSETFNNMVSRIKQLMEQAVSAEEQKRQIEIKALQAQINPHFLYNTLDTIIWMSASGKNDEVVKVTSALARLFRTSVSNGDSLVSVAMEVQNIESYLTIQKMRYKDKLSYQIDIPAELTALKTPKLILQPIVENAVYHGIKLAPGGGEIRIGARREKEMLVFTVEDNGVGMTQQQLDTIFIHKEDTDHGIGVINVNNRLRLLFGERYGLRYTSSPGAGTKVELCLPLIEGGEEAYG